MKTLPLFALLLIQNVAAAQWRISWAQAQVGVNYRVCRVVGSSLTPLGTTAYYTDGIHATATAFDAMEAAFSDIEP